MNDRYEQQYNARRRINAMTFALQGDDDHAWAGIGLSTFNAAITGGSVDVEGNATYRSIDSNYARTDGGFTRANLEVSRLQHLTRDWSILGRIRGQWSSTNLDSSQKFYIGGATSVSGYPLGEAGGDKGADLHLELRRDFVAPWNGTLTAGLFYEQGWIKNHNNTWPGWQGTNPIIENDLTLKSFGISANATLDSAWVLRASVGRQIGSNKMREPGTGDASDGSSKDYRAWFQAVRYF